MKLSLYVLLLAACLALDWQSRGLVSDIPVICQPGFQYCGYPLTYPNTTGVVIARQAYGGALSDSQGTVYTLDFVAPFTGVSVYHANFTSPNYPVGRTLNLPAGTDKAILLTYAGHADLAGVSEGDYDHSNEDVQPPGTCANGGGCAYWWTYPRAGKAGELLITAVDTNASGSGPVQPGAGWQIEASTDGAGQLVVEDMIAPMDGLQFGNMKVPHNPDGTISEGSHWIMGLVAYRRTQ